MKGLKFVPFVLHWGTRVTVIFSVDYILIFGREVDVSKLLMTELRGLIDGRTWG